MPLRILTSGPGAAGGNKILRNPATGKIWHYDDTKDMSACRYLRARLCPGQGDVFDVPVQRSCKNIDFEAVYTVNESGQCVYFDPADVETLWFLNCAGEDTPLTVFEGTCEECVAPEGCCTSLLATISGQTAPADGINGAHELTQVDVNVWEKESFANPGAPFETEGDYSISVFQGENGCYRVNATYIVADTLTPGQPGDSYQMQWLATADGDKTPESPCPEGHCPEDSSPYDIEIEHDDPSTVTIVCDDDI